MVRGLARGDVLMSPQADLREAQPCGCDPGCRVPPYDVTIVTPNGGIAVIALAIYTCSEFPSCPFGVSFIAGIQDQL